MLKIDNVSFSYLNGVQVLKDVAAEFDSGLHLIKGDKGSGKTTLFEVIAGLLDPTQGECLLGKESTAYHSPHAIKDIFLLRDQCPLPLDTVNDMALLHGEFYPYFSIDFLAKALAVFGIKGDDKLSIMTDEDQRKAQLAYALSIGTNILMMDEPFNGLDSRTKELLVQLILHALERDHKRCIIIATPEDGEFDIPSEKVKSVSTLKDGTLVQQYN